MRTTFAWSTLCVLTTILGIHSSVAIAAKDPAPFKYERPGKVFNTVNGDPAGNFANIDGINTYLTRPPGKSGRSNETAILYLTDIFGVALVNNKLLGDSLARAGYFVVIPDLFNGEPVPVDAMGSPGWNMTAWRERHPTAQVDAIVEKTIASMRTKLGVKKIGAVGYCFGGKFVARFLAQGKGLDAGFTAHPSAVVEAEWSAITAPLSIAFGDLDGSNTPAQRARSEAIFKEKNATYQTTLYSNAEHGFAVRTNLTDPQKKFAQESAYVQAVRWFDAWIK